MGFSNNSFFDVFMYCLIFCFLEEEDRIWIIDIFYFYGGCYRCCVSKVFLFYYFFLYKSNVREDVLFVEYFSVFGDVRFVYMENKSNVEYMFIKCWYSYGYFSLIFDNKCIFLNILELDLFDN